MYKRMCAFLLVGMLLLTTQCAYFAEPAATVTVDQLFTDNMVLQQNISVPVWGTATPGGKVTVEFNGQRKGTKADATGKWQVKLDEMTFGGPYELVIIGKDSIKLSNVLVGEVWICSGQSNMEMPMNAHWTNATIENAAEEISNATYPNIRLFTVEKASSTQPLDSIQTTGWQVCSPATVKSFSATGYFFGRHLNTTLDIPIGLIHTSWGGTVAEAWTSAEFLKTLPQYTERVEEIQSIDPDSVQAIFAKRMADWQAQMDAKLKESQNTDAKWQDPELDDSSWKTMPIPGLWEQNPGLLRFDGIIWLRTDFTLNAAPTEAAELHLGMIDDADTTFVNGTKVGDTNGYTAERVYTVPANLLQAGKNTIAVYVLDTGGGGGIYGDASEVYLQVGSEKISLAKPWRYKSGLDFADLPTRPQEFNNPNRPTVLYNAMINPLLPFAIKGAIWYQGESNASRAFEYRTLFPTMINSWRAAWNIGDFPFYFVQLANFQAVNNQPVESDWAELREAQLMTLSLPNTGMAVTIDIGEADDIHPSNKQDVGKRLALNARALTYGENIVYCGPIYRDMKITDNKVQLTFDHVGSGLVAKGDKLVGFSIAGEDRNFVWADAVIDGETVVVSSPAVEKPYAVRYAWSNNPVCNLYNKEDLPASPFRTDDWPGITQPTEEQ